MLSLINIGCFFPNQIYFICSTDLSKQYLLRAFTVKTLSHSYEKFSMWKIILHNIIFLKGNIFNILKCPRWVHYLYRQSWVFNGCSKKKDRPERIEKKNTAYAVEGKKRWKHYYFKDDICWLLWLLFTLWTEPFNNCGSVLVPNLAGCPLFHQALLFPSLSFTVYSNWTIETVRGCASLKK